MNLYMKQRMFSFKQDFDIFDENQRPVYHVEGEMFSFGRRLHIQKTQTWEELALVKQKLLTLMPQVDVYVRDEHVTSIRKKLTFFRQSYELDGLGWDIEGDIFAHEYDIYDRENDHIASISKKFFAMSDTFEIRINRDEVEPVMVVAVVLAIDAVMDSDD